LPCALRLAAQRAFIICESFFRPAALIPPPLPPLLFFFALAPLLPVLEVLAALLWPPAALVRAQRARAAAAMRSRPAADRPRRRRFPVPALLELAVELLVPELLAILLLAPPERPSRLESLPCKWSI